MTPYPPESVERAVVMALDLLNDDEKLLISQTPEDKLGMMHFGLSAIFRNGLGLWRADATELLEAIANSDPTHPSVNDWGDSLSVDADGASAVLLRAIRRRLIADSQD
jgi:hypothetical protein